MCSWRSAPLHPISARQRYPEVPGPLLTYCLLPFPFPQVVTDICCQLSALASLALSRNLMAAAPVPPPNACSAFQQLKCLVLNRTKGCPGSDRMECDGRWAVGRQWPRVRPTPTPWLPLPGMRVLPTSVGGDGSYARERFACLLARSFSRQKRNRGPDGRAPCPNTHAPPWGK